MPLNGNASDDKDNCATTKHFGRDEVLTIWKIVYIISRNKFERDDKFSYDNSKQEQTVFHFLILVVFVRLF